LLGIVSAASGHLAPDPRLVVLMSEGDLPHIIVTVALTCVCAPLVEEVLFRGLLLESLRGRNTGTALVVSGAAFAVWHLNPSALRYYAIMGLLLGGLYVRRGLVCSMAAHAAFNGVLTVAALAVVLSPAKPVTVGHVTFGAPGGWTKVVDSSSAAPFVFGAESASALEMTGPSGAILAVLDRTFIAGQTPAELTQRIEDGQLAADYPGLSVDVASTRQVELPAGPTVEVDVSIDGHNGTIAYLVLPSETVKFMFFSGGSMKAQSDFGRILDSVQVA